MESSGEDVFEFDPSKPTTARVYGAALDPRDTYAADRELAAEITNLTPYAKDIAGWNHGFLQRALWYVAGQGIKQFVDIGPGLPLSTFNTHQIALANHADARTAYVDKDPLVVTRWRGMLGTHPQAIAMHGDLNDPKDILTSPALTECVDLGQPAVVVLGAILHFLPGDDAFTAIEYIKRGLRKGSYLIVSHATADDVDEELIRKAKEIYKKLDPLTYRTHAEVARLFDGWEIVDPGVVGINDWRPTEKVAAPAVLYGGVARKP